MRKARGLRAARDRRAAACINRAAGRDPPRHRGKAPMPFPGRGRAPRREKGRVVPARPSRAPCLRIRHRCLAGRSIAAPARRLEPGRGLCRELHRGPCPGPCPEPRREPPPPEPRPGLLRGPYQEPCRVPDQALLRVPCPALRHREARGRLPVRRGPAVPASSAPRLRWRQSPGPAAGGSRPTRRLARWAEPLRTAHRNTGAIRPIAMSVARRCQAGR